ncbi:MAG: DUF1616 domain-containing protein [Methanothrix sp.]|nr:DUF1616 domain-containing protein [Methanothrix sp.]
MQDYRDLFAVIALVVVTAVFVMVSPLNETPLRALLGLALAFFAPGYALISALFPGRELDAIERLALSIGLSICIVVLIGIGLNYTPWGIRVEPILFSVSAFTLAFAGVSAHRRSGGAGRLDGLDDH